MVYVDRLIKTLTRVYNSIKYNLYILRNRKEIAFLLKPLPEDIV